MGSARSTDSRTGVEGAGLAIDTSASGDDTIGLMPLAGGGAQIVGPPGLQARPLDDGTSIGTVRMFAFPPWPAGRRVLPRLLPPENCHVEQSVAVAHRLDAPARSPVGLEDPAALSQVANDVHHARPAPNQESVERVLGRVPRHIPTHKVAVPDAFFVRALAERGVSDITGMQEGQLADLGRI